MSPCRTSCISSARVFAGKTIDLLVPWLAAVVLVSGAVLLLAPSGHGALAYDELVATRVAATPTVAHSGLPPARRRSGPRNEFHPELRSRATPEQFIQRRKLNVVSATWSSNLGEAGGFVTDDATRVSWRETAARK